MKSPTFRIKKAERIHGSSDPLGRLFWEVLDLLTAVPLPPARNTAIVQRLTEVSDDLGGARDHADAYLRAEREYLESPQGVGAIDIQTHAIYVPLAPRVGEEFEDFLVDAARG